MATKAQKIRVGVFVVVTTALLALVLIVFGGLRFWERHSRYHVVFTGSVMGLEHGAQVHLNGMRVGRVDRIAADPDDLRRVRVTIAVEDGTPIHADTKAVLQFAGITGLKVIDLRDGTHTAPLLAPGATIAEGETVLDTLEREAKTLASQSSQLMTRANQIVENVLQVTDPARFAGLDDVIARVRVTADNLARTSETIDAMVRENRTAVRGSIAAVDAAATRATTLLDTEVAGILAKAGDVVGSLGTLVRANEGQLRSALFDLRQASRNFKELSREVRQRPSRLLFSSPPAERKLP